MKFSKKSPLFANPEQLDDDELDDLFGQLQQFEPPASLVENIMSTVSKLPPYSQPAERDAPGLVAHSKQRH